MTSRAARADQACTRKPGGSSVQAEAASGARSRQTWWRGRGRGRGEGAAEAHVDGAVQVAAGSRARRWGGARSAPRVPAAPCSRPISSMWPISVWNGGWCIATTTGSRRLCVELGFEPGQPLRRSSAPWLAPGTHGVERDQAQRAHAHRVLHEAVGAAVAEVARGREAAAQLVAVVVVAGHQVDRHRAAGPAGARDARTRPRGRSRSGRR